MSSEKTSLLAAEVGNAKNGSVNDLTNDSENVTSTGKFTIVSTLRTCYSIC